MGDQQHSQVPADEWIAREKRRREVDSQRKDWATGSIVTLPPIIRVRHPISMRTESNYSVRRENRTGDYYEENGCFNWGVIPRNGTQRCALDFAGKYPKNATK